MGLKTGLSYPSANNGYHFQGYIPQDFIGESPITNSWVKGKLYLESKQLLWSPISFLELVAWYDTKNLENILVDDFTFVTSLLDLSDNQNHVTPGTSKATTSFYGGLDFNTDNIYYSTLNTIPQHTEISYCSVFYLRDTGHTFTGRLISWSDDKNNGFNLAVGNSTTFYFSFNGWKGDLPAVMEPITKGMKILVLTYSSLTQRVTIRINGLTQVDFITGATSPVTAKLYLGNWESVLLNDPRTMNGLKYEDLVVNRIITLEEQRKVEGYLAHRWGLSSKLPLAHPYRRRPPLFNTLDTLNYNNTQYFKDLTVDNSTGQVGIPINFDSSNTSIYLITGVLSYSAATIAKVTWTPSQLTSLTLWLDASDESTIAKDVNNKVSQWDDKSGNNNNATQIDSAERPSISNSIVNTSNGGRFDINLDFMAAQDHSFFAVVKNLNTERTWIYGDSKGGDGNNSLHVGFEFTSYYQQAYWGSNYSAPINNFIFNEFNIVNWRWFDNSSRSVICNGVLEGNNNMSGSIGVMSGGGSLFAVAEQTSVYHPCHVEISEIVCILNSDITQLNTEKIEGYLAHKWNLTDKLPANHPYKSTKPTV